MLDAHKIIAYLDRREKELCNRQKEAAYWGKHDAEIQHFSYSIKEVRKAKVFIKDLERKNEST